MLYRAAIIGCGFIAVEAPDNHAQAYIDCPDTELVALCDKEEWKADRFLSDDIELVTSNYYDMLRLSHPDIVSICTPPETHCRIVCDIAPYVKAIYVEKPIATLLGCADKMIKTCHNNNVILQVNHQRRFIRPKMRWSREFRWNSSHAFDLMRQLDILDKVDMEYVDTDEPIFELSITQDRMILKGVEHLVECLKEGKQSISSGEEARENLRLALRFRDERYKENRH